MIHCILFDETYRIELEPCIPVHAIMHLYAVYDKNGKFITYF